MAFKKVDFERAVGMGVLALKVGPARRESKIYDGLVRLGVLQKPLSSWPVEGVLKTLPWGSGSVEYPEPKTPEGIDGPWPQNPILYPDFPSPVLNIERSDIIDHFRATATRYTGQTLLGIPSAAWRAKLRPRLKSVSDQSFESILTRTSFAQFLLPIVAPKERDAFADDLKAGPDVAFGTMDFSGLTGARLLPGVYMASTVVLLRQRAAHEWSVVAIRCNEHVFRPDDGPHWELAKYFVLQGTQCHYLDVVHPRLHFPLDAANAITRSLLPGNHRLKMLLTPHFRYTLGLHKAVIHHQRGAGHNSQREAHSCLPYDVASFHDGFKLGLSGRGDEAFPPYGLNNVHIGTYTAYGQYRQAWYHHILNFTRRVVGTLETGDPAVTEWADAISPWIAGFPDGKTIWNDDVLAQTVATVIATVSVFHSADHQSFFRIPREELPFRLRQAPPDGSELKALDLKSLVLPEDHFRALIARKLLFEPVIREDLPSVKYGFRSAEARDAAAEFNDGMSALDQDWGSRGFATSRELAASIQY